MLDAQHPTRRAPDADRRPFVRYIHTVDRFVLCELVRMGHRIEIATRHRARGWQFRASFHARSFSHVSDSLVTRRGRHDDCRHLRLPLICRRTAAVASYHDQSVAGLNSGVCTRHVLKEGSIDVSNWESFPHCRAYGSRENGVLIKARINIGIK